jgi:PAS domain-containing protein
VGDTPGRWVVKFSQAGMGTRTAAEAVFEELTALARVMAHLPHAQPFAAVSADGWVLAANRPMVELLGCQERELVGSPWSVFLPAWDERAHPLPTEGVQCFESVLQSPWRPDDVAWVHVVADPVGGDVGPHAYAVFVTSSVSERANPGVTLAPA